MRILGNRIRIRPITVPRSGTIFTLEDPIEKAAIVSVGDKVTEPLLVPGTIILIKGYLGAAKIPGSTDLVLSVRDVLGVET